MPNEFKIKNGLLVDQGGAQVTGSLFVTGGLAIYSSASIFPTSSTVLSVDGAAGRLFQVDDTLSGSLHSVNTIAGLPILEVFSDNTVRIGQYGRRAFFVSQSAVGIGKETALNGILDISGSTNITGSLAVLSGSFTVTTGSGIEFQVLATGIKIGNIVTDTHNVTGSFRVSGSITGSLTGSVTGSLFGTSSWASNALTSSYVLTTSNAVTTFTKGISLVNNTFLVATDSGSIGAIWRAPFTCTASIVAAYRDAGTGAVVQAMKNGSNLLSANLSLTTASGWVSSSANQNQNFNIGDSLGINIINFTGSITDLTVQVEFILRP